MEEETEEGGFVELNALSTDTMELIRNTMNAICTEMRNAHAEAELKSGTKIDLHSSIIGTGFANIIMGVYQNFGQFPMSCVYQGGEMGIQMAINVIGVVRSNDALINNPPASGAVN